MHTSTLSELGNEAMVQDQKKTIPSWISWFFGLVLVIAVVLFAVPRSEGQAIADLVARARPVWLVLGLLLQMGTYVAEAPIWERVLLRRDTQDEPR